MPEPIIHRFRVCELRIFPETEYVETLFRDGARAGATRESSDMGNVEYARHLGYPDCWTALVCHEAAHTWLSERLGFLFSPTLHAVAHEYGPGTAPYEERLFEEALTLGFERFCNTGVSVAVLEHPSIELHLARWAREFRVFSAHLMNSAEAA